MRLMLPEVRHNLEDMKSCERCGNRDFRYACPVCKRNERYLAQGEDLAPCGRCGVKTKLSGSGSCYPCLRIQGLRECGLCKKTLSQFLDFHPKRSACKICERGHADLTKAERARDRSLRKKYGLNLESFKAILQAQGGVCAICKRIPQEPVVDHSHITGRVRGILCHACNIGIGNLQDSPAILESAQAYLREEPRGALPEVVSRGLEYEALLTKVQSALEKIYRLEDDNEDLERQLAALKSEPQISPDVLVAWLLGFRRYIEDPRGRDSRNLKAIDEQLERLGFRLGHEGAR